MPQLRIALTRATDTGFMVSRAEDVFDVAPLADGERLDRISLTFDGMTLLDIPLGMVPMRFPVDGVIVPLPDYPED